VSAALVESDIRQGGFEVVSRRTILLIDLPLNASATGPMTTSGGSLSLANHEGDPVSA
jgi:hypothetical protein